MRLHKKFKEKQTKRNLWRKINANKFNILINWLLLQIQKALSIVLKKKESRFVSKCENVLLIVSFHRRRRKVLLHCSLEKLFPPSCNIEAAPIDNGRWDRTIFYDLNNFIPPFKNPCIRAVVAWTFLSRFTSAPFSSLSFSVSSDK